jgi:competence protein ComEA
MLNKIKKYFTYSASERNGLLVILFLIVIVVVMIFIQDYTTSDSSKLTSMNLDSMLVSLDSEKQQFEKTNQVELKSFDPNKLSVGGWQKLGFTEKQESSILSYVSKAGKFKKPEDLLKLYVIDSVKYEELEPFIKISAVDYGNSSKRKSISINSCSAAQLVSLPGIGKFRAEKIINFREKLGGFASMNQIADTYGIGWDVFIQFKDQIFIEDSSWIMFHINTISTADLAKHAYISEETAEKIVFYRETVGMFQTNNDLVHMDLISENLYVKLQPYLRIIQ